MNDKWKMGYIFFIMFAIFCFSRIEVSAANLVKDGLYIKDEVSFIIDGKTVNFSDPILNKNGHILIPMRSFYEEIQAKVDWSKSDLIATATKGENTISLKLNSKTAKVNGQDVSMEVAALQYRYRTYIPLRFVSEHLDGKVNWNQAKQTATITTYKKAEEKPDYVSAGPYLIHIGNKQIMMDEPLLIKEGRTYIPVKYFHDYLTNSTGKWISDQEFELQLSDSIFSFTDKNNEIFVNQQPVRVNETPFIYSNQMYVPIHFIVNSLGGNIRILRDKQHLYIYLYDHMFTSRFIEKVARQTGYPSAVSGAQLEGSRNLLVSDNPETLTPTLITDENVTLAEHRIYSSYSTKEHRIFGWHSNKLGNDARIGITIENTSSYSNLQVVTSKGFGRTSSNSWINYDIGLSISDRVLNNTLRSSLSTGVIIAPGETKTIEAYDLNSNYVIGFVHDLDIRSVNGGNGSYIIRTVLSQNNGDLSSVRSSPVPIDPFAGHPRGAWQSSTIVTNFPTYTIGDNGIGYSISNGKTDHLLTSFNSQSNVNGSYGNPGHFGMTYKVNIPIYNPTGLSKTIKIKIAGRGGYYSGAVKINGTVYLIPTLKPSTELVELPYTLNGWNDTIQLEIMHSGGASLPLAIYVEGS